MEAKADPKSAPAAGACSPVTGRSMSKYRDLAGAFANMAQELPL